ncbi:hypothetical protein D9M70_597570 [compost metagenome]
MGTLRDVYPARHTALLHTGGSIYRIAPYIICKFLNPDNAGDQGSGMNTDANIQSVRHLQFALRYKIDNIVCCSNCIYRMHLICQWQTTYRQISIPYCFYFLQSVLLHNTVKSREMDIQFVQ